VFLTVAEYDGNYLDYLKVKPSSTSTKSKSFLTVHQYGPWDTTLGSHMRSLGPILLAITLWAEEKRQRRELMKRANASRG